MRRKKGRWAGGRRCHQGQAVEQRSHLYTKTSTLALRQTRTMRPSRGTCKRTELARSRGAQYPGIEVSLGKNSSLCTRLLLQWNQKEIREKSIEEKLRKIGVIFKEYEPAKYLKIYENEGDCVDFFYKGVQNLDKGMENIQSKLGHLKFSLQFLKIQKCKFLGITIVANQNAKFG